MKSIEQIAKEFIKEFKKNNKDITVYVGSNWIFYNAISGFYNDSYFDVYFRVSEDYNEIEISHTTKNLDNILLIIRNIEPLVKIKTHKIITNYETITL